ncbi:hypothetical protein Droror1_Dr00015034 [Drosera rotundifolia]
MASSSTPTSLSSLSLILTHPHYTLRLSLRPRAFNLRLLSSTPRPAAHLRLSRPHRTRCLFVSVAFTRNFSGLRSKPVARKRPEANMMSGLTSATVLAVIGKIVLAFCVLYPFLNICCHRALQIISNDLFKSPEQRGLSRPIEPRLSIGCFFHPGDKNKERAYDPLKELISEENPKLYKDTSVVEYQKGLWFLCSRCKQCT